MGFISRDLTPANEIYLPGFISHYLPQVRFISRDLPPASEIYLPGQLRGSSFIPELAFERCSPVNPFCLSPKFFFSIFFTLISCLSRSLSLKLSEARVYAPQIPHRVGIIHGHCGTKYLRGTGGFIRSLTSDPWWQELCGAGGARPEALRSRQLFHRDSKLNRRNNYGLTNLVRLSR